MDAAHVSMLVFRGLSIHLTLGARLLWRDLLSLSTLCVLMVSMHLTVGARLPRHDLLSSSAMSDDGSVNLCHVLVHFSTLLLVSWLCDARFGMYTLALRLLIATRFRSMLPV